MRYKNKIFSISLLILLLGLSGCDKEWLNEDPLASLSSSAFWKSKNDALLALHGIYQYDWSSNDISPARAFVWNTDEGRFKTGIGTWTAGQFYDPSETVVVKPLWTNAYRTIYRCNWFLENIENVDMETELKAQYIAEARAIRAHQYFWLSFRWGDVPLIKEVLTLEEANSQTRTSKQEVVNFVLTELTSAAADLPKTRPASEKGRVLKSFALTIKGRLLMIEKRWAEAAAAFKEIIDSDAHSLYQNADFNSLWAERGNNSNEIIYAKDCNEGNTSYRNGYYMTNFIPGFFSGFDELNAYQELVDDFLMIDGLPIETSPLYDPANPFDNRDPRLYFFVFLPEYTRFKGLLTEEKLFLAHPDNTNFGIKSLVGATGYHCKKFADTQQPTRYTGADYIHIRYPEVLLSYLESMIESEATITQEMLDKTINLVRGRASVNMPAVTETNTALLRQIVRRERRVELCFEPFIRHMDLVRWGLWPECMNRKFHGMKLTDDPGNYTDYPVNEKGHLISWDRTGHFKSTNLLLPIPQTELDINADLGQNPGY